MPEAVRKTVYTANRLYAGAHTNFIVYISVNNLPTWDKITGKNCPTSGSQCQWDVFEVCRHPFPSGSNPGNRHLLSGAFPNKRSGGPGSQIPARSRHELDRSTGDTHTSSLTGKKEDQNRNENTGFDVHFFWWNECFQWKSIQLVSNEYLLQPQITACFLLWQCCRSSGEHTAVLRWQSSPFKL